MGLDIIAFQNLEELCDTPLDENGDPIRVEKGWSPSVSMEVSERYFPGRGEGLNADKTYLYESTFGFRAGSYSGYNWWRSHLELLAEDEAFEELIDFSDCEGVIGPVVSQKLAQDFQNYEDKAKKYAQTIEDGEFWYDCFTKWKNAFEMATKNGAVLFC